MFRVGYEQNGNIIALWVKEQTNRMLTIGSWRFELPATWFQSLNPFIIIICTPLLTCYWARWEKKHGRPNLLRRMSFGCLMGAGASLIMIFAALVYASKGEPVSALWVIAYFVLLTFGELFVLPIGLALFGTISPVKVASIMMGFWYIAKFIGSLIAGYVGVFWEVVPQYQFFAMGLVCALAAALLAFVVSLKPRHSK